MTNTYLIEVIKVLTPAERKEMALFLASPYFNKGSNAEELKHLYQIIIEAAPEVSDFILNKEKVYFKIFSAQKIVPGKLEKLMTDLNKLLRNFLLTQRYFSEDNQAEQQIEWAVWLRERGLSDRSLQLTTKLKTQTERDKTESVESHRQNLLIAEEAHLWELNHNQAKGDLNIPNLIYLLDLYYHNYRIELSNRYLLQQKVTELPEVNFSESGIDSYIKESKLLQISKNIFDMLKDEISSSDEIQHLIQLLNESEKTLSIQTLDHFYAYIRNFCTLLINAGNLAIIPILHQINIENLERGYFFLFGKIPTHAYLNLVQAAIKAKEYGWAKKFVDDYKGLIIGGDQDQFFYRLNMAQCLFAEGDFENALDQLPIASSGDHYHHMIRRLELKIYYEQRSELLEYKIDAFRKFIERTAPKTISANLRAMDFNFLKILLQLSQSPIKDKARSLRMIKRIDEKKLLADRAWLLEKAKEIG